MSKLKKETDMKILAIESSAVTASVAIVTDETITAEYTINYKKTHSQTLLPMIDEICEMTDTDMDSIDVFAVSTGPGSFTGLRIGAATGKGLAMAAGKPMAAVPTLDALAYNIYGTDKLICPIMDAKRSNVYSNIYYYDEANRLCRVRNISLVSIETLANELNEMAKPVIFLGDGVGVAREIFEKMLTCPYEYAPANVAMQKASGVAMAAMRIADEGGLIDSDELHPDYLRPSQAERELNSKNEGNS